MLFVISLISINGLAQEHSVSGKVIDQYSKEPLPYTTVCLVKKDSTHKRVACTQTNLQGEFTITTDAHGDLLIEAQDIEHKKYSEVISFENNITLKKPIALKTDILELETTTVIGHKKAEFQKEIGSASVISKKELELEAPIGAGDALQKATGVYVAGDDGFGNSRLSVGIRGLNPRRSARVLILEDGLPVQPAPYIYPNSYYNPPIERIDEIEIIKGSGTIKYGPQTMGGVINYITTRPTDSLSGSLRLTGGTYGYASIFTDISGFGKNSKFKSGVQLLAKKGDGFREHNNFRQYNVTFKNLWKINKKHTLYTKLNYNDEFANATYTGLTDYSFERDPTYNPKENDEFSIQRFGADFIISTKHSDSLTSTTSLYANHFKRDWWRENDEFIRPSFLNNYNKGFDVGSPTGSGTTLQFQTPAAGSQNKLIRVANRQNNYGILRQFYVIGLEKRYKYKHRLAKKKATLSAGARAHSEIFKDNFVIGDSPTDRTGKYFNVIGYDSTRNIEIKEPLKDKFNTAKSSTYETRAFSLYGEETVELNNRLIVNAGVRLEVFEQSQIDKLNGNSYSDKFSAVMLPSAGFNYALDSGSTWNMFGGIHRGYTAPTSGLFNIPFVSGVNSTTELVPEKSWNTELGIRHNGGLLTTESALFYNNISDMIAAARGSVFLEPARVSIIGFETSMDVKLDNKSKFLPRIHLKYTYLDAKIIEGTTTDFNATSSTPEAERIVTVNDKQLPYAPPHAFVLGVSKKLFRNKIRLYVDYNYTASVFTDIQNLTTEDVEGTAAQGLGIAGKVPAWGIWNSGLLFKHKKMTYSISGKNLLDTIYISSRLHSHPSRTAAGQSSGILIGARRQVNFSITYKF